MTEVLKALRNSMNGNQRREDLFDEYHFPVGQKDPVSKFLFKCTSSDAKNA